jgi:DNA-binding CsgD family transcriptional regulator
LQPRYRVAPVAPWAFLGRATYDCLMEYLRPVERRVLALHEQGESMEDIAARLKRSPDHIERMMDWAQIPRSGPPTRRSPSARQRRIMALRSAGESYEQIAERFRKSSDFIKRVEGLAHLRMAVELLRS